MRVFLMLISFFILTNFQIYKKENDYLKQVNDKEISLYQSKKIAMYSIEKFEGGYSNDKRDAGGETNRGITLYTFMAINKQHKFGHTKEDFYNMTDDIWVKYFDVFWDYVKADHIENVKIRLFVLDLIWNSGNKGIYILKRSLNELGHNVNMNTPITNKTVDFINKCNSDVLFDKLYKKRESLFKTCCPQFYVGLKRRIDHYKNLQF
jgi:lysozyme family protein